MSYCIQTRIMNFQPTYLMIKHHRDTGLMYFCKTATRDPLKYHGSGNYWKKHLKIHGKNIQTIWYQKFDDQSDLVEFALFFSEFNKIVTAVDKNGRKIWANEVPEDGLQGGQNRGMPSPLKGIPQPNVSHALTGRKRPEHSALLTGVPKTDEHKKNISLSLKQYERTAEHSANISKGKLGKKLTKPRVYEEYTCPHCGTIGKGPNMSRYHFENCKHKGK